jgi:uncharacterized protein YecT (DUF1311 family)
LSRLDCRSDQGDIASMKPHCKHVARAAGVLMLCALAAVDTRVLAAGCEDAMTSAEMLTCASRQYETAKSTLEDVYRHLAARLPAPRRAQLEAAQKAWTTYRDAQAAFVAGAAEDGTLYPILQISEQAALTEARIDALRQAPE